MFPQIATPEWHQRKRDNWFQAKQQLEMKCDELRAKLQSLERYRKALVTVLVKEEEVWKHSE
jgi:hypothetical protein